MTTIRDELLQNDEFNKTTLKLLIDDEFQRIANSNLRTISELKKILETHYKTGTLQSLHNTLKSIIAKKEESKTTNNLCKCESDCGCETPVIIVKLEDMVVSRLEKLAYELGKNGNQEAAYEVERTANQLK